jgi:hypothetical protein
MPRIQGLAESGIKTADTLIKSAPGYVFSLTLAYSGVTAGERCTLIDGLTDAGDDEVPIIFPAANGVLQLNWAQGKQFDTGIFFNKGASAGSVFFECTYK